MAVNEQRVRTFVSASRLASAVLIAVALACALPLQAAAEALTLTTYYPAPYGVYQELRSTQDSYLAYQSGKVGIGTTNVNANNKLGVGGAVAIGSGYAATAAPANGMIVQGQVGIGTASPGAQLEVHSASRGQVAGDFRGANPLLGAGDVFRVKRYRTDGSNSIRVRENGDVTLAEASGGVIVGATSLGGTRAKLRVYGGYLRLGSAGTNCSAKTATGVGSSMCPGGRYATFFPGIYQNGVVRTPATILSGSGGLMGNVELRNVVTFYCCFK